MVTKTKAPQGRQPRRGSTARAVKQQLYSKDTTHYETRQPSVPRWWGRMREQARVARSLQDGGLLSLSQTGTEALSAIDDGEIPWETVHALFQAWQSRDDLRQLAPDGLFDREDRREYGRWYAERQFELFGAILLALGQIEDSGSTEFRNRHETRNRIKSRQDNELRISGSGVPANSGEGGTA